MLFYYQLHHAVKNPMWCVLNCHVNNATMQLMQNSIFSVFIEWPGQNSPNNSSKSSLHWRKNINTEQHKHFCSGHFVNPTWSEVKERFFQAFWVRRPEHPQNEEMTPFLKHSVFQWSMSICLTVQNNKASWSV